MLREWKLNEQQRKKITLESKYEESPYKILVLEFVENFKIGIS